MTKPLNAALLTLFGLVVSAPAMAQVQPAYDDFEVTLTILPPVSNEVQVLGLDDIIFGQIALQANGDTSVPTQSDHICLNRNTPGNVLVTFDQLTDAESGPGFRMAQGGQDYLPFAIRLTDPTGVDWPVSAACNSPPRAVRKDATQPLRPPPTLAIELI